MFIQTLKPPVAGQDFAFSIAGACGVTSIEVRVGERRILKCLNEERMCRAAAHVPATAAGKLLTVTAIDEHGNSKHLEYEISAADPGPHSMLSSSRQRACAWAR
jgi:hypothetical protein